MKPLAAASFMAAALLFILFFWQKGGIVINCGEAAIENKVIEARASEKSIADRREDKIIRIDETPREDKIIRVSIDRENSAEFNTEREMKYAAPIFLRCVFPRGEIFNLILDSDAIDNPRNYRVNIFTDLSEKPVKIDIDFARNLEIGKRYELFFNKNPYSIGGVREHRERPAKNRAVAGFAAAEIGAGANKPDLGYPQTIKRQSAETAR